MPTLWPARSLRVLRSIAPMLAVPRGLMIPIPVLAGLAGLMEATLLLVIATTGVALSRSQDEVLLSAGPLEWDLPVSGAILFGLGLAAASIGIQLVVAHLGAQVVARSGRTIRNRLSHAFLQAEWSLQSRERLGHLQELMTTYITALSQAANTWVTLLAGLLSVAAMLLVAAVASPVFALVMLALAAFLAVLLRPIGKATRRRAGRARDANKLVATSVAEVVDTALETRILGVTGPVGDVLDQRAGRAAEATRRVVFLNRAVPPLYQGLAIALLLVGLVLVMWLVDDPESLAVFGALALILLRAVSYGRQVYTSLNGLQSTYPYVRELQREIDVLRARPARGGDRPVRSIGRLELRDVEYRYDEAHPALRGVSVCIEQGQRIGIVGPSGSGKTTLIQILTRLRTPQEGTYLVDGVPADELELDGFFTRLGVVPQQAHLIEASVEDNIRFYRDLSFEQVVSAARRARIHEEIEQMPRGYATPIGGSGGSVSVGQAQRISIARALAADPDLLVLDEPTSALDMRSETLVGETLTSLHGEVTIVIIAHRLSTVQRCDRILVLHEGRLVADDRPEHLARSNEFYREALELSRLP